METLSRELEARAHRLAVASVEWMYQDPFWEARYGAERSRRFGHEDALFHVRYLMQSLAEERPSVMEGYATWLRTLLVTRGMCTLHLDQNFAGLQAALTVEGFGPGSPAQAYVQAARTALRYPAGHARTLQDRSAELARRATQELLTELPATHHPRLEEELLIHIAYLADAIGTGHPEAFARHVDWYRGFWPLREFGELSFDRLLAALGAALSASLLDHDEVKAVFAASRTSMEKPP
jgi:hypothetical protein